MKTITVVPLTVVLLLALFTFQTRRSRSAAEARELPRSIAASEAQLIEFRETVRATSGAEGASGGTGSRVVVHACNYPSSPGNAKQTDTGLLSLLLPADFVRQNVERSEKNAATYGSTRYDWRAPDGSTVSIQASDRQSVHRDWTGLISSECDILVGGLDVHVDIADASSYSHNVVVHGHFVDRQRFSVKFIGHARSPERQSELLHSLRTLSISSRWGLPP